MKLAASQSKLFIPPKPCTHSLLCREDCLAHRISGNQTLCTLCFNFRVMWVMSDLLNIWAANWENCFTSAFLMKITGNMCWIIFNVPVFPSWAFELRKKGSRIHKAVKQKANTARTESDILNSRSRVCSVWKCVNSFKKEKHWFTWGIYKKIRGKHFKLKHFTCATFIWPSLDQSCTHRLQFQFVAVCGLSCCFCEV